MTIKKKDNLLMFCVTILFVSLLLLCFYLIVRSQKTKDSVPIVAVPSAAVYPTIAPWEVYSNSEFSFSLEVPRLLLKQQSRDSGGYKYLIFFGENQYSQGSGIAVGITDRSLEKEIAETKKEYDKDESAELVSEKDIEVAGEKGKQLSYKPKVSAKDLESRDVVIVHHGKYTYTISTIPKQVPHLLESFGFL